MKRFVTATVALTLFSTSNVFGANHISDGDVFSFLTINGTPVKQYYDFDNDKENDSINNSNGSNNVPEHTQKPSIPDIVQKPDEPNISTSNIEQEVVRLVNIERAKVGLNPLIMDNNLSEVARLKSEDMKRKGYFSHTSPTYGTPFDMLRKFNITYRSAGENIARGQRTAQDVVNAWMNSEGHRRNILSKSFTHIGVGHSSKYWTQLFIAK